MFKSIKLRKKKYSKLHLIMIENYYNFIHTLDKLKKCMKAKITPKRESFSKKKFKIQRLKTNIIEKLLCIKLNLSILKSKKCNNDKNHEHKCSL